jgi:hypothetical protein
MKWLKLKTQLDGLVEVGTDAENTDKGKEMEATQGQMGEGGRRRPSNLYITRTPQEDNRQGWASGDTGRWTP